MAFYTFPIPTLIYSARLPTIFLALVIVLGGCSATVVHKPLDPGLANRNYNLSVYSIIPANEIASAFQSETYTNAGGGLLWYLIDKGINSYRAETAETRISPLLEASANFDFRHE